VALVPMTKAEVTRLCANVTPKIREFCTLHMGLGADYPEFLLSGCTASDDAVQPYSEAQWWELLNERVVTRSVGPSTSDAAQ
jgi:hypothetical protein